FFIDKVDSYASDEGIIKRLFIRAFDQIKERYSDWAGKEALRVQASYFATRNRRGGTTEAIDTNGKGKEDEAAFNLIRRDKERLLSFDEPVSFIFAHSALREGWDNPNVFQICTLNQTISEMRKRQEIGRGLRLCVNQLGKRVVGDEINVLTVVANQSYQSYAEQLQQEYRDEGQEGDAPPPPSSATRDTARRNDGLFKRNSDFKDLWSRLSKRLRYDISLDTDE